MAEDIPGFERDPEIEELLDKDVSELDEETRSEVQLYKSRMLQAKRDAGMSSDTPPWEGDRSDVSTESEPAETGDTSSESSSAGKAEDEDDTESGETQTEDEPEEDEAGDDRVPADEAGGEATGSEAVDFEEDPEMEDLLEEDIMDLDEETRIEVQKYKSQKMKARRSAREDGAEEESKDSGEAADSAGGAPEDTPDEKSAPPADGEKRHEGERKIKELVESRSGGRDVSRRGFLSSFGLGVAGFLGVLGIGGTATGRFFFPNVLSNPPEQFVAGEPSDYPTNTVSDEFKSQYRVWIVNLGERIVAINAICTHLGCTPNWLESQGIFKCPCHGSGYYMTGVNFEGPAPRPMDRVGVRLSPTGKIIVDKSMKFSSQATPGWDAKDAYISV